VAGNALTQQTLVDLGDQIKPLRGKGIETLTQGGARRHVTQVQRAFEEVVVPKILYGIKGPFVIPCGT
jgi:hypothetical protein